MCKLFSRNSYILYIVLFSVSSLNALNVRVNGEDYSSVLSEMSRDKTYFLQSADSAPCQGVILSDLLPPLFESWSLVIETGEERRQIERDDLWALYEKTGLRKVSADCWDLLWPDGTVYHDVTGLYIQGEILDNPYLEVWISWEGTDLLKEEIQGYAERHNLNIKVVNLPNPSSKFLSVMRAGGNLPDVIMLSAGNMNKLVQFGALQNIPTCLGSELLTAGVENFSVRNRLWALPFYYDTQVIFYNPDFIDLSRYEQLTLEQLEKSAESLIGKVQVPLTWNAYSSTWLDPFRYAFGRKSILNEDGTITLDDPGTQKALEYIAGLSKSGFFRPMEKDAMLSFFATGRAGIILSASYSIPYFENLGIPFEVAPFPLNQETGLPVAPMLDFKAFGISRKTRNPVLAHRLLAYLVGTGVQQRFPVALSKLPVNRNAAGIVRTWNPYYRTLLDSGEWGMVVPASKTYSIYKNTMWKLLRFVLTGQMTPEMALRKGQQLIDEEMKYAAPMEY